VKEPSVGMAPVKIWPCSKRRTSFTSRVRLWASMVNMPGTSEGRRREASSESGFSRGMGAARPVAELEESGSLSRLPTLAAKSGREDGAPRVSAGTEDGEPGFWFGLWVRG